jgi:ZIP family zinc transporter
MLYAALVGGLAAASLLVGFAIAGRGLSSRSIGLIMAFGSGALLSAIAYELIPESSIESGYAALAVLLGAVAFFLGDWVVDRRGGADRKGIEAEEGSGAAIFVGTLLDNLPESVVLGMGLFTGGAVNVAFMVAVFVSNLPEGVAGTVNLLAAGHPRTRIGWLWLTLVAVSGAAAAAGYAFATRSPAADGSFWEAFAAGAMLTMLADTMIPEAYEHGGKLVGLVVVIGFLTAAALSVAG